MCVMLFFLVAGWTASQTALAVSLAPTDDTFGYQFLPAMNLSGGGFGAVLPVGKTTTGHNTRSVLKFDVASTGLTGAQVASATLDLFAIDTTTTGFGANPSLGSPLTVDLFALAAAPAWTEGAVTYATIPATAGQFATEVVTGFNQVVSIDVTLLVQQWLDGVLSNNGLVMDANAAVGGSPSWVYASFSSAEGGVSPQLVITPVPEPASFALAAVGLVALAWAWRRKRSA
jgi:hypothetical protein